MTRPRRTASNSRLGAFAAASFTSSARNASVMGFFLSRYLFQDTGFGTEDFAYHMKRLAQSSIGFVVPSPLAFLGDIF
jgi:hypothetical protein